MKQHLTHALAAVLVGTLTVLALWLAVEVLISIIINIIFDRIPL